MLLTHSFRRSTPTHLELCESPAPSLWRALWVSTPFCWDQGSTSAYPFPLASPLCTMYMWPWTAALELQGPDCPSRGSCCGGQHRSETYLSVWTLIWAPKSSRTFSLCGGACVRKLGIYCKLQMGQNAKCSSYKVDFQEALHKLW